MSCYVASRKVKGCSESRFTPSLGSTRAYIPGPNPFSLLGFVIQDQILHFKEWDGQQQQWIWSPDLPNMPLASVRYNLSYITNTTFDQFFPVYDWSAHKGFDNLGTWVETAAKAAGR